MKGDIEVQDRSAGSSIPPRHPPMSDTTVDWSLLGRVKEPPAISSGAKGRTNKVLGQDEGFRKGGQENSGKGTQGRVGIKI